MTRKMKVLLIGASFSAELHSDGYSRIPNKVEIAGICDKNEERICLLAERYGFEGYEAYTDFNEAIIRCECDIVDICLPNFLHHDVAIAALKRGRHVICEKPLATTVEDGRHMVDTAKAAGKHIYYAEDWLFAPAFKRAISIVESGRLGKPLYIRARESHSGSHSPFAQKLKYCGGGCMMHLGVHPVSFMLALKNNRWVSVLGTTSGGLEKNLVYKDMEGEDWAASFMEFEDGTYATLEANYVTIGGMEDIMDIYCEKGCLHVDLSFSGPIRCFSTEGIDYTVEKANITMGWSTPAVDEKYNLGYVGEISHFIDCAASNSEAALGLRGEDGLAALEVIKYIYDSAREGRRVLNPNMETQP